MSSPNAWLLSDNSRYSTRMRLLFMGLSFAIGILTFLLYLALWYVCSCCRRQRGAGGVPVSAAGQGMSAAAIAALPTFAYEGAEPAAATDCAVCLGQVEPGEKVQRLPKCAHLFHAECVDAWLRAHSTCPMCRAAVGPATATTAKKTGATETITPVPAAAPAPAEALPPV